MHRLNRHGFRRFNAVAGRTKIRTTDITVNVKFTQCYYVRQTVVSQYDPTSQSSRCTRTCVRRWQWIGTSASASVSGDIREISSRGFDKNSRKLIKRSTTRNVNCLFLILEISIIAILKDFLKKSYRKKAKWVENAWGSLRNFPFARVMQMTDRFT